MEALKERFSFMPKDVFNTFDEEGNVTGTEEREWSYAGKEEYEKKLLEAHEKRIQEARFGIFQEEQSLQERLLVNGNIDEAISRAKRASATLLRHYDPNDPQYANLNKDLRDRTSGFYDWRKWEAEKLQRKKKEMSYLDCYNMEMFIRPQIIGGDGTVIVGYDDKKNPITTDYKSLLEAMQGYIFYEREAFMHSKGGENALNLQLWEARRAEIFDTFDTKVVTALGKIKPELAPYYKDFVEGDIFTSKNSEFYNSDIENLSPYEKDLYVNGRINLFRSIFFNGITDVPTIKQMMREGTGKQILRMITQRDLPNANEEGDRLKQLKAFSDKAMSGEAEHILFVNHNPERLNVSGKTNKPTYEFLSKNHEDAVNMVGQEELKYAANILGLGVHVLAPGWMESPTIKGDVIPKMTFTVVSEFSSEQGTYYLDYDKDANPVVMKLNEKGEWKPYKEGTRPLTQRETINRNVRTMNDYTQAIRNGKNPITGEDFDYSGPPPGSTITKAQWNDQGYINRNRIQKDVLWANHFMNQNQEAR
jgi:hypothetical protein